MATVEAKLDDDKELSEFMTNLYDVRQINDDEVKEWYEAMRYKGFDRKKVLRELWKKIGDIKVIQQIVIACGILGPQRAALAKLPNGRTINSLGIPASGLKGSEGISCQRITSATADLCAYFLKKVNFPKRLNLPCPGWLQFPSAGSIVLPNELRLAHQEFAIRFSNVIGGVFNEQIYMQMVSNSYLDPKLKLFDEPILLIQSSASIPTPAPIFDPNRGSVGPTKSGATERIKPVKP